MKDTRFPTGPTNSPTHSQPMKKILLITFVLSLVTGAGAQGTINFGSTSTNHVVLYGNPGAFGTPVGTGFSAALYWGPSGSLEGWLIQLGTSASVQAGTGFIIGGGTRTTGVATAGGANAVFQVRAWNGGFATYEQAVSSGLTPWAGKGQLFTNPTGDPAASPPGTPAFLTGWTTPVYVGIPEPSAGALFGLGVGLVTLFRATRKKQT